MPYQGFSTLPSTNHLTKMAETKTIILRKQGQRSSMSSLLVASVLIFLLTLNVASAELFHLNRDRSLPNAEIPTDRHIVTTYDQCKTYLCKYGYLKDCDCQESLIRDKRNILDDGMFPSELISESMASNIVQPTPSEAIRTSTTSPPQNLPTCDALHFRHALARFQNIYRLNQTGECDTRTKSLMSKPRCGQPDTVIDTDEDVSEESTPTRARRSLGEMIKGGAPGVEKQIERRKKQLKKYLLDIEKETLDNLVETEDTDREKRSLFDVTINGDYPGLLSKKTVTWRLMRDHYFSALPAASQRSILRLAFRYWSEVSPICFKEDTRSAEADIEIGFMGRFHLGCSRRFDGFGGEVAHKLYRDVHFDNSESYTDKAPSPSEISLKLVAVHELGHVIGLNHSNITDSVMNAVYHENIHGDFELNDHDRRTVKRAYGPCSGSFNTVFDLVRTIQLNNGDSQRIFNSFFFRQDHYWMYENTNARTRFGDPLTIEDEWNGLPAQIDAFIHSYEVVGINPMTGDSIISDEHMFLSGDRYYVYDVDTDSVADSGLIRSKFPTGSMALPTHIDTAYLDPRDKLTYFFSGDDVYVYHYKPSISHSCCVSKYKIIELFPPTSSADLNPRNGVTYRRSIDSVYLSYTKQTLYFIKGEDVWQNTEFSLRSSGNSMTYVGKWNTLWEYICDGKCS